jgi:ABC-type glutathione transport system ATPase component
MLYSNPRRAAVGVAALKELKMRRPDAELDANPPLLSVTDLQIRFWDAEPVVKSVSFDVHEGEVLAIAGQSGSGKSLTGLAIMGLLPDSAQVSGSIRYRGTELVGASEATRMTLRGAEIAMVFQETNTALNPVLTIGSQLRGAIRAHSRVSKNEAMVRASAALEDVSITDTDRVLRSYPHQLSGGMCQRVVIAMALACGSHLLIADEPTTALDVSVQRGILNLLSRLVQDRHLACIFVSHDLGVLEEIADNVVVMLDGRVVEQGPMQATINDPLHPYTSELLGHLMPLSGQWVRPLASPLQVEQSAASSSGSGQPLVQVSADRYVRCSLYDDFLYLDRADGKALSGEFLR